MAIDVRIPTILRTYTGGAKAVEGTGSTLSELFTDLEQRHGGLRDRLVDDGGLRRFVNVYLNDVRLALGVRLGVTEEFEEQWASIGQDDPQWAAVEVYAWLGAVQESLVQALA